MTPQIDQTVRKSIIVKAGAERAFRVFTEGIDTWWPRTHHIGASPMKKTILEGRSGGRCYTEQEDGTECDWGQVLDWDPPRRFVMAWQVSPTWQYEPDLTRSSEVEVRFTGERDGSTRVDLEHRHFERHGAGWEQMRAQIDAAGGWGGMLQMFATKAEAA
jgi:Activator of Hsp90 ATPase homolog 1-like protein